MRFIWIVSVKTKRGKIWNPLACFDEKRRSAANRRYSAECRRWPNLQIKLGRYVEWI